MTELVLVRAETEEALVAELARLVAFLDRVPEVALLDVAYTCARTLFGPCTLAVIADDVPSLRARLVSAKSRLAGGKLARIRDKSGTYYVREHLLGEGRGKLAFVYPGVMSFYPDMLRDLAVDYPACRSAFDELEEALKDDPDFTPSSFIFPPAPYYRHDADIFSSGAYAEALVALTAFGAKDAMMSGSGSVVYGFATDAAEAEVIASQMRALGCTAWVTKALGKENP